MNYRLFSVMLCNAALLSAATALAAPTDGQPAVTPQTPKAESAQTESSKTETIGTQSSKSVAQKATKIKEAAEQKDHSLDQTVVTATRTEKDIDTAPGSISVVTKDDIEKQNVVTYDDALKAVPGVVVARSKGVVDSSGSITLRGLPGQGRTLVMVDGIQMNSPHAASIVSTQVAPGTLDRIEVLKGASSGLYGGSAMGGVVNLITRMPTKREFMIQGGYGSGMDAPAPQLTKRVAVSYGDSFYDKLSVYFYNEYTDSDGYKSSPIFTSSAPTAGITGYSLSTDATGAQRRYVIGDKGMNGMWQNNFTFKTELQATPTTKLRFTLMKSTGAYSYSDPSTYLRNAAGTPVWSYGATVKPYTFYDGPGYKDQYIYAFGVDSEIATAKVKLNLGFMDQKEAWDVSTLSGATGDGGPGKVSSYPASSWNADLQASIPVLNWNLVTVGGAFRTGNSHAREFSLSNWKDENSKTAVTYDSKGSDRVFAVFVQDEISITDKLTVYAGFRQDWWETFDGYVNNTGYLDSRSATAFSPKGAIVYTPFEKTTLRVSGGRAFRPPTNYDLYRSMTSSGTTYLANPNLKPETNTSWDASITQKLWEGAKVSVTYYENYLTDMIYSSLTQTGPSTYTSSKVNAGKAESKGVEMEAEQRFGKMARLFANYTYAATKITSNEAVPASVGKQMTGVPEHMFNFGGDIEYGPFGAYFVGRYVGKRFSNDTNSDRAKGVYGVYDPYFVGDIKLRYKITNWATASFTVNNIWDERYYSYYMAPGRSCYGDITFKF